MSAAAKQYLADDRLAVAVDLVLDKTVEAVAGAINATLAKLLDPEPLEMQDRHFKSPVPSVTQATAPAELPKHKLAVLAKMPGKLLELRQGLDDLLEELNVIGDPTNGEERALCYAREMTALIRSLESDVLELSPNEASASKPEPHAEAATA